MSKSTKSLIAIIGLILATTAALATVAVMGTHATPTIPASNSVSGACLSLSSEVVQEKILKGGDGRVTDHPQSTVGRPWPAERVARAVARAAERRKNLLVLSLAGVLGYWVHRLAPDLYERLMAGRFQSELQR